MFASIVDRFSLCWNITKKIKIGVPRTEPLGAPAGSDSASAAARVRLYTWRWKRRKRSNAGEQLCVNTSLVNLTETVPTTKRWHSGWLNIPSGFKKWPAELAPSLPVPPSSLPLDAPLCRWQCLCLYATYTLQSSMVWYPWFTLNITKLMTTIRRKKHNNMRFYAFIDTIMWIYNEIKGIFLGKKGICCYSHFKRRPLSRQKHSVYVCYWEGWEGFLPAFL